MKVMQRFDPRWLDLAKRLQAMGQTGLEFATDHYNRERYAAVREIAFEMMEAGFGAEGTEMSAAFASEVGYATPKVDVRAAVFRDDGKVLLVRELADGRWSLPGGWLDVGESPRDAVAREVLEESGYVVTTTRLLAVLDKGKHPHPPQPFTVVKIFIEGVLTPDEPMRTDGLEVTESGFFGLNALPPLSLDRILPEQVELMFRLHADPGAPAVVD